ncbi:ChrR family anti-sigma-E factor [Vibrio sp. V39_P1S14PM300]|uniref:ChrR family anti-sigma-E factor n=1 Tax=Vibrio sp. V39_P1S14PM300 TaxID=1938690 RepID=UPI001372B7ED|nr:ChrR family anti-sigma-E factor [Vibrio sp. V39_P1S14PM300]NAX22798.1 transcriptional regulator [Vibrio sp. V39_P1S14PM300]
MSYHPEQHLLDAYAAGSIDAVHGLAVATHLESCSRCRALVAVKERECAQAVMNGPATLVANGSEEFAGMFEAIVALDPIQPKAVQAPPTAVLEVNGKQFRLPGTLSKHVRQIGEWRSYGGKVYSAAMDLGEDNVRVNLMYIAEDVHIPQHTHKGLESTLVLHGGFSDEDGHYEAGDFMTRDASVRHSPFTRTGEDCLCMTVLTEPMLFTQGVARIFNLFGKGLYP